MIKVCHITSAHQRYDVRIFLKQCISLANHGYDVYLLVNDDKEDEINNNVKIISTKYQPNSRIKRFLLSHKYIYKKVLEIDADIYCIHDPDLLSMSSRLKKCGKKVIFDSHEFYVSQIIYEKQYIPKILRGIIATLYDQYEKFIVKKIDAVLVPTTFAEKNIFENKAKKTVLINNVPKLEEFYDLYVESRKEDFTICHIGTLSNIRGINQLINAAYLSQTKLILGGLFVTNEFENQMKCKTEFDIVEYRGYISRTEVLQIYKECSIGICTILNVGQNSMLDNFATKVYEYMSMCLPVIISDYPYARKMINNYKFGLIVNPENEIEISNAINYLRENPEVAREMGRQGRKLIKDNFNWTIEEKKLLELYTSLE